jgi:hypothetical protein
VAKLPLSLRTDPDRRLEDLQPGETGYMTAGCMYVTPEMDCWLSLHSRVVKKPELLEILRVTRKDDGYHVAILAHHKWAPEPLPPEKRHRCVPVATLMEDYDPRLDRFYKVD